MKKLQLTIPEPCHENWQLMTPVEKGKFCGACQKKVFDFTHATDREIIQAYNNDQKLCGRFLKTQLDRNLTIPKEKKSIWLASVFFGMISLANTKIVAQEKPKTEEISTYSKTVKEPVDVIPNKNNEFFEITGIVLDDSGPLPGANVTIKGTQTGVSTDFSGAFKIKVKKGDILIFTFMGMNEKQVKIKNNIKKTYKIKVKLQEAVLGGLGIIEKTSDFSISNIFKNIKIYS